MFMAGVFLMFAPVGVLADVTHLGADPFRRLVTNILFSGGIAVVYVVVARRPQWLPALAVAHIALATQFERILPARTAPLAGAALQARLSADTAAISIAIVASFVLLTRVLNREGARLVRARTEIALARDIHRLLVPPFSRRIGRFEFCGISVPSGDVGGDLVDLVDAGERWIGYVADVSGHGVGAGLLMGMVKSATRTQLRAAPSLSALLNELNAVLLDLSRPDMFVTFAGMQFDRASGLQFSLAGHLPILHCRPAASAVDELSLAQVPLAMFGDRRYTSAPVAFDPGDLFVILTDGLTEVFDSHDRELGLEGIKGVIRQHADAPLDRVKDALLAAAHGHGPQLDDQTLLLIRASA
jgi:serine phosphatase RsbU (regulator of sigma subunit)